MSQIPFVNQLGDAIEAALADRARKRRPWRRPPHRIGVVAAAAVLTVGGAGAAFALLSDDPTQLAAGGIGCYEQADLEANVTVPGYSGLRSPADVCAEALGVPADGLVACSGGEAVVVIPGAGPTACRRLELAPLPRVAYDRGRERIVALERAVAALESKADCIAPERLAEGVQGVLREQGWVGWTTAESPYAEDYSCGSVLMAGGDATRSIEGALDVEAHTVLINRNAPRSTLDALYSEGGIDDQLFHLSATRCFTAGELRHEVKSAVASAGLGLASFAVEDPGPNIGIAGERGRRLDAGCVVFAGSSVAADGRNVRAVAYQRG